MFAVGTAAGSILIYDLKVSYMWLLHHWVRMCARMCVREGGREGGRVALGLFTYEQMLSKQSYNLELVVSV